IRGKIDRVDLAKHPERDEALCAVIDYKSGAKRIDPLLQQHGIQVQLPAYLAALRRIADPRQVFGVKRLVPAGIFYVSLRGSYKAAATGRVVLTGAREAGRRASRHFGRLRFDALQQFDRQAPAGNSGQFNYALTNAGKADRRFADLLGADEFNGL